MLFEKIIELAKEHGWKQQPEVGPR